MVKKILVVDDSASWRKFHLSAIESIFGNSVECTVASSATEAYDVVLQNLSEPFDVMLSDLQMELSYEPDTAGEWLVKQVKLLSQYKNTKIIVISAMFNIENIAYNLDVEFLRKSTLVSSILPFKLKMDELTSR